MEKTCKTCDHGSKNELSDIICVSSDSANCCEFMGENDHCPQWQNYDLEFWGDNTDSNECCCTCANWCMVDGVCGESGDKTTPDDYCDEWNDNIHKIAVAGSGVINKSSLVKQMLQAIERIKTRNEVINLHLQYKN